MDGPTTSATLVSRVKLQMQVNYDAPARECRRVLRILPRHRPGQEVLSETWRCSPRPQKFAELSDQWGNRRLLLLHREIPCQLQLELLLEVRCAASRLDRAIDLPEAGLGTFLLASRLADLSPEVRQQARSLSGQHRGVDLLGHLGEWTHHRLKYGGDPEPRPLPASQVLQRSNGSCQDLAHLLIALCRASGLPARYVAGYSPAQGLLHAWVEALVGDEWHAYDPTHARPPAPGCIVVGVGRDYRDVRPVAGSYRGNGASLTLSCQTQISPDHQEFQA